MKFLLSILLVVCSTSLSFAGVYVKRFPTDTPVFVAGATSAATTDGNCAEFDANGNIIDSGSACGGGGGTPGGSTTQVQYNNAGSFAGSSSFVFNGSNVGIGSVNPTGILDIQSATNSQLVIGDGAGNSSGWRFNTTSGLFTKSNYPLTVTGGLQVTNTANAPSYILGSGGVGIGTTITSNAGLSIMNGNVGIGTWKPSVPLYVVGDIQTNAGSAIGTNNGSVTLRADQVLSNTAAVYSSNGVALNYYNGSAVTTGLVLKANGAVANVGIGSTNPNSLLNVNGNVGIGTTGTGSTPYQLNINNVAVFNSEYTNANIGIGTTTIDWNKGNYQNVGIGTSSGAYIAFTHPTNGGVAKLQLRIKQDGTGSRVVSFWPATVLWTGGTAPTLTTTAGKSDIINCTWNGVNDYCASTLNF